MIGLKIRPYQSPISLSTVPGQNGSMVISGSIELNSTCRQVIPGLEVIFAVMMDQRAEVGKKWSRPQIIDIYQTAVVQGNQEVDAGLSTFEFNLRINCSIPCSRVTQFDRVFHRIHAVIPQQPPAYTVTEHATALRLPQSQLKKLLMSKLSHPSDTFRHPITKVASIATTTEEVQVYGSKYLDAAPVPGWVDVVDIPELGSEIVLRSDQNLISLGSILDIQLNLRNLCPDLTLHSWSMTLHQDTVSASGTLLSSPPTSYQDVFTIGGDKNLTHLYVCPGRDRPKEGSYIWRGTNARELDGISSPKNVDTSEFTLSLRARLPSPMIGGIPSSTGVAGFASVQHTFRITLYYSILGEDLRGQELPRKNGLPVEGTIRTWTYTRPMSILSDLQGLEKAPTPTYSEHCDDLDVVDLMLKSSKLVSSLNLPHMASMLQSRADLLRPAEPNLDILKHRIATHWRDTGGLCSCFDEQNIKGDEACRDDGTTNLHESSKGHAMLAYLQ
ncbi:uncharacterized protein I206_100001 [Kwoniella pini CBS 10737]|uniref:Arrestin-like N-terminal domain-containing protein n=1 Tax=Kwoniella pini CBS 10737 TaxID=1296096 RepID=A0A1B9HSA5_9TREE|nr:uncharacterized protein I206_07816 [Kwoniella pini CBS 10737]OCF46146.1 hypothetical protein I206_07816 [Kwoniella pini CBS 10737]